MSALIRAYDPCLNCPTHAAGQVALRIELLSPQGTLVDELRTE